MQKIVKIFNIVTILGLTSCLGVVGELSQTGESSDSELALALGGVSGSGTGPGSASDAGSGESGPLGSSFTSSDGKLTIHIPPGAMDDEQEFNITKYTPATESMPGSFIPTSDVYEIKPSYRFKKPVTVNISVDSGKIQAYNLSKSSSLGFSMSRTSPTADTGRMTGWLAHDSHVENDTLVFTTLTFSLFGGATPPSGNRAPVIMGAYYHFMPGCRYVPNKVSAQVFDPDGDTLKVYLITGRVATNSLTNTLEMTRVGSSRWYELELPYEVYTLQNTGIKMQILAVDTQNGLNASHPTASVFEYPTDSGNPVFISNFDNDAESGGAGDNYLCIWEQRNAPPNTTTSLDQIDHSGSYPDADGDGIPDAFDETPNGGVPDVDSVELMPSEVSMNIGEKEAFGIVAKKAGVQKFINWNSNITFNTTGNALNGSPVGNLAGSVFEANHPGAASVNFMSSDPITLNATATVVVSDSVGPNPITDLVANTVSQSTIQLNWSAPGDDGKYGKAVAYLIIRSTTPITNNASCNGTMVTHNIIPAQAGSSQSLSVNGLSPATTYYFCIRAFDDNGNMNNWNGTVFAKTNSIPDLIAPADVVSVTPTAVGSNSIKLSWSASGDDGNTGSASSYEIRKSTNPITTDTQCSNAIEVINSAPATPAGSPVEYTVNGLSDNTIYYFCVRAVDDGGNRSRWNSVVSLATPYANKAPNAVITYDASSIIAGMEKTLSASQSTDPDKAFCGAGDMSAYQWSIMIKPALSSAATIVPSGTNNENATFVPDIPGEYTLQLQVTDDAGSCADGNKIGVALATVTALPAPDRVALWTYFGLRPGAHLELFSAGDAIVLTPDYEYLITALGYWDSPHILTANGYTELLVGYVYPEQVPGTVPIYLYQNNGIKDALIICDTGHQTRLANSNYSYIATIGYAAPAAINGANKQIKEYWYQSIMMYNGDDTFSFSMNSVLLPNEIPPNGVIPYQFRYDTGCFVWPTVN